MQCSQLPQPIFTPATKEESGHDQNITFERMGEIVGDEVASELAAAASTIYAVRAEHARKPRHHHCRHEVRMGLGRSGDRTELILIDEVLTPDSSRFWPADQYQPAAAPAVVRQAIPARMAGNDRLGQEQPAARSCPRMSLPRPVRNTSRPTSD